MPKMRSIRHFARCEMWYSWNSTRTLTLVRKLLRDQSKNHLGVCLLFVAGSCPHFFDRSQSVIPLIRWKESEANVTLRGLNCDIHKSALPHWRWRENFEHQSLCSRDYYYFLFCSTSCIHRRSKRPSYIGQKKTETWKYSHEAASYSRPYSLSPFYPRQNKQTESMIKDQSFLSFIMA
jgi:hypothetical protein